jgi:hypothetical protein
VQRDQLLQMPAPPAGTYLLEKSLWEVAAVLVAAGVARQLALGLPLQQLVQLAPRLQRPASPPGISTYSGEIQCQLQLARRQLEAT